MRFTPNLPGDLYTPAECVEQVEYFTQQIQKKFNSEYGPDIHNERLEILEFLYLKIPGKYFPKILSLQRRK